MACGTADSVGCYGELSTGGLLLSALYVVCCMLWAALAAVVSVAPLTSRDTVGKSHTAVRSACSHVGTRRTIALSCNGVFA